MINGFCVNVIAVKTGPVKFDREHQSKGGNKKTTGGLRGNKWRSASRKLEETDHKSSLLIYFCERYLQQNVPQKKQKLSSYSISSLAFTLIKIWVDCYIYF